MYNFPPRIISHRRRSRDYNTRLPIKNRNNDFIHLTQYYMYILLDAFNSYIKGIFKGHLTFDKKEKKSSSPFRGY
jgi:hypothetical protein